MLHNCGLLALPIFDLESKVMLERGLLKDNCKIHQLSYHSCLICMHISSCTYFSVNGSVSSSAGAFEPDVHNWFGDVVLYIFGIIHLLFSLWMAVEYFMVNWPNFILPCFTYRFIPRCVYGLHTHACTHSNSTIYLNAPPFQWSGHT